MCHPLATLAFARLPLIQECSIPMKSGCWQKMFFIFQRSLLMFLQVDCRTSYTSGRRGKGKGSIIFAVLCFSPSHLSEGGERLCCVAVIDFHKLLKCAVLCSSSLQLFFTHTFCLLFATQVKAGQGKPQLGVPHWLTVQVDFCALTWVWFAFTQTVVFLEDFSIDVDAQCWTFLTP